MIKEKQISRNTHFKGRVFKVHIDQIYNHLNEPTTREVLEHSGGVGILPYDEKGIYLIKQYRYVVDAFLYEIPAGKLELNEDVLQGAIRELKEETGFTANQLEYVSYIYPTPGYSTEKIHTYLATQLEKGSTNFDRDEQIELIYMSLEEALTLIDTHQITDAKTIIAIYYLYRKKVV